jgi:pyrroline-5-carboxylate reductase
LTETSGRVKNIAFLGGGNMATALIGGLIAKGADARSISVVELSPAAREKLGGRFPVHVSTAPDAAVQRAEVVVLAVKPQDMRAALASISGTLDEKLIVSIAAGIRIDALSRWLGGHRRIVRCMPNTPALIGAGVTGLYAPAEVSSGDRKKAEDILRAVGEVVWVANEKLIDAVTAVSGSGPAYVFWLVEQLAAYAESTGIPKQEALSLAKHCLLGSAQLAMSSKETPGELRRNVTSKGGTTEAALRVFETEKLAQGLRKALEAATRRGGELGDELAKD